VRSREEEVLASSSVPSTVKWWLDMSLRRFASATTAAKS
jgi:hypothetical protein